MGYWSYPQSPKMDSVEQPTEVLIPEETVTPRKEGEASSAAQSATDILNAIEGLKIGNSPEAERVKELVKKFEEVVSEEAKRKTTTGSDVSTSSRSWVNLPSP